MRAERRFRAVGPAVREAARTFRQQPTPAEALLWERLRDRRLGGLKFRRQHAVLGFVLDFYCPERRLAIEVDGAVHAAPEQRARDAERSKQLAAAGVRVLRLDNAEVLNNTGAALATIARAAAAHGARGG
ncbi:MAG TPA: endonuclease domain-containing protein [Dehalococcoidia bacterium]|nr:endonuclease domain-containing protein [Dehalococcoidia bacterium]